MRVYRIFEMLTIQIIIISSLYVISELGLGIKLIIIQQKT
ncbi:hypothetical protein T190115A13A_30030 [Tenacibaculum sp. 190524A02b]|uniref:Uncharacterized protein n=1 Tax=Tenacibaculum vairaonense TaxID=3137860 RepID=A0ABP1FF38_9FLAO